MCKVSIIIPIYNSINTIDETINSILSQNYKSFEIIIIDDGSTDSIKKYMKKYEKNPTIKLFFQENKGVSFARNKGIDVASGEYICFMDSDDIMTINALELYVKEIEQYDICTFGYIEFNSKTMFEKKCENLVTENFSKYIEILNKNDLLNPVWNKIYKKEIIDKYNIKFDESISIAEDLKFNIDYFKYIKKFKVCNEIVYKYRINEYGLGLKFRIDSGQIRLDIDKKTRELIMKKNEDILVIDKQIIKDFYAFYSKIVDKRLKYSIKQKKIMIRNFQKNNYEIIESIHKKRLNFKFRLLANILKINNVELIFILSQIANKLDLKYKEKRLAK